MMINDLIYRTACDAVNDGCGYDRRTDTYSPTEVAEWVAYKLDHDEWLNRGHDARRSSD